MKINLSVTSYQLSAYRRGFTLVETLVAITILLVSIVGPYYIAAKGLFSANVARDQVTAYYLAQEPIEYSRNLRDQNGLRGLPWLTGLDNCLSGNTCYVDVPNGTIGLCSGTCPVIKLDTSTHLYNYLTGNNSIFTRSTAITTINEHEVAISVSVSWLAGTISRSFVIRENIFDWQ
ncbi:MAG: prepilin-type N-terminal cleavage/methylation domain-containing protein [Patescibacteria group bacterium]